jgi:hypothetical protein
MEKLSQVAIGALPEAQAGRAGKQHKQKLQFWYVWHLKGLWNFQFVSVAEKEVADCSAVLVRIKNAPFSEKSR